MPEITLKLDDPAKTVALLRDASAAAGSDGWNHTAGQHARWLAGQIEEQVKPAVEEPTELWSVINANVPGSRFLEPKQLVRSGVGWLDADGNSWGEFEAFSDVEVLRVGLGEDGDAFNDGMREMNAAIHQKVRALLADAITSERKNAYEKAIQAVEELAP